MDLNILENLFSSDEQIRKKSELVLSDLAEKDFKEYLTILCSVLANEGVHWKLRQMATTLIKNPIAKIPKYSDIWKGFDDQYKDNIKQLILATLGSGQAEIRKCGALIIATIIKTELPLTEKWPSLLPLLCQSKFDKKEFHLAAIETLGNICEEISKKDMNSNEIDTILSAIILAVKENMNEYEIAFGSLKALIKSLPLIGFMKMSNKEYSSIIMSEIFKLGDAYQNNEIMLEYICKVFIEIAENYYDTVEFYLDQIASFTLLMIQSNNERLRILGFEFWCRLGSEEVERMKAGRKSFPCRFYLQSYFLKLLDVINVFILPKQGDDDDDEWNTSKASCFVLVSLSQVINLQLYETVCNSIRENINSDNEGLLKKAIITLTCSLESVHKTQAFQLAIQHTNKISNILTSNRAIELKIIASRSLIMITKVIGKYFEPPNLKMLIPLFKSCIYQNNKLGINVCLSLNNIIIALGDQNTNKSTNHIAPYFNDLANDLLNCDQKIENFDKDNNLSIYCFLTLENLLAYSSHDKQGKLLEILICLVFKLQEVGNKPLPSNIILDLQSHYTRLIRIILVKLVKPLSLDDSKRIYEIIVQTFIRRNLYDEGILALSSLALNIKSSFTYFLQLKEHNFNQFLVSALGKEKYFDQFLVKSGVIAVGDILECTGEDFSEYAHLYMPLFEQILNEDDIKKEIKLSVISLVGKICFRITKHFIPYFNQNITLLINACQIALMHSEDDFDFEEYLQDLRHTIISTFTMFFYGLDDCGRAVEFEPFIGQIFNFYSVLIMNDSYELKGETLKQMLGFIMDMISTIGRNIKKVVNVAVLEKLIFKIKETKSEKIIAYVNECENDLKLIWSE